jgi:hypothetical protein
MSFLQKQWTFLQRMLLVEACSRRQNLPHLRFCLAHSLVVLFIMLEALFVLYAYTIPGAADAFETHRPIMAQPTMGTTRAAGTAYLACNHPRAADNRARKRNGGIDGAVEV